MTKLGKFGKALALVLVFWCAGTGCVLVSYASDGETPGAESTSAPSDGMTTAPSCHAQRQGNRKTTAKTTAADRVGQLNLPMPSRSGAMSCCPLTSGSIAAASRSQSNNSAPALANTESQILNLAHLTKVPVAIPLRLPNRAHSYLLDCVFLI